MDDPAQSLRAREAEAMCDHVWIFEASEQARAVALVDVGKAVPS
jgi:hypothetical protein